eukprot:4399741-Prymnesium_polylepis.1
MRTGCQPPHVGSTLLAAGAAASSAAVPATAPNLGQPPSRRRSCAYNGQDSSGGAKRSAPKYTGWWNHSLSPMGAHAAQCGCAAWSAHL